MAIYGGVGRALLLSLLCCCEAQQGLFVSTSAFGNGSTAYGTLVTTALELICDHFTYKTSPNFVKSLALDHLTDVDGNYLSASIKGLEPYFKCFDAVYIGTADNHFATTDLYCTALTNETFTTQYVARSLASAKRFDAEHAELHNVRWYLNYEAAGNYFGTGCSHFTATQQLPPKHPTVTAAAFTEAYIMMFAVLSEGLHAIRDVSIMWSPTFNWEASFVPDRQRLLANLILLLKGVPLLREVMNQDAIGKYSLYDVHQKSWTYNLTCADTVYYQTLLKEAAHGALVAGPARAATIGEEAYSSLSRHRDGVMSSTARRYSDSEAARTLVEVSVNMELFSRRNTVPVTTITGDPFEHQRRRCCYASHNLTLGASWEITDWYRASFTEWDPNPSENIHSIKE